MADEPAVVVKFNVLEASAYLDYNSTVLNRIISLADAVAAADMLSTVNHKALSLADTFSVADNTGELVGADIAQAANDTLSTADAVVKSIQPTLSEVVTGTDTLAMGVTKALADTTTLTDSVLLDHGILLADTMSAGDSVTAVIPVSTWNPADDIHTALSSGNRKSTIDNSGLIGGARTITGRNTGKFYFAVSLDTLSNSGLEAVGIKLSGGSPNDARGITANEAGWAVSSGDIRSNGNTLLSSQYPNVADVVGFAVDLDAGQFYVQQNGTWLNSANPTTGFHAFGGISAGSTYFPSMSGVNGTSMTLVSGTPPSGYAAWN